MCLLFCRVNSILNNSQYSVRDKLFLDWPQYPTIVLRRFCIDLFLFFFLPIDLSRSNSPIFASDTVFYRQNRHSWCCQRARCCRRASQFDSLIIARYRVDPLGLHAERFFSRFNISFPPFINLSPIIPLPRAIDLSLSVHLSVSPVVPRFSMFARTKSVSSSCFDLSLLSSRVPEFHFVST